MMKTLNNCVSSVCSTLEFNEASLSGSVDVIVVKQKDGSLKCTGFHVRFGKFQVLRCKDRTVRMMVNGHSTGIEMKLGHTGEAYFEQEVALDSEENKSSPYFDLRDSNPSQMYIPDQFEAPLEQMTPPRTTHQRTKMIFDSFWGMFNKARKGTKPMRVGRLISTRKDDGTTQQNLNQLFTKKNAEYVKENIEKPTIQDKNSNSTASTQSSTTSLEVENNLQKDMPKLGYPDRLPSLEFQTVKSQESEPRPPRPILTSDHKISGSTYIKKTLRLNSDQLLSLNLKPGKNEMTFVVDAGLQGEQSLSANIYLWDYKAKVIATDIDGTLTRSDVLGALLPLIGKDWTQPGIAPLFSNIARNGYHILYLSSRAIGQISFSRDFVKSVHQDDRTLPDGPVISSPDQLFTCFRREMIFSKPEFFKSAALRDIKNLFPSDTNPFHAAFGNRENDAIAYRYVGIPLDMIFSVNQNGDLEPYSNAMLRTYAYINTKVKDMFPCAGNPSSNYRP